MPSSETLEFLRCVLPGEGHGFYVGVVFTEGRPWQFTESSLEIYARRLLDFDAQGRTVYHACATIKDARGVWNEKKKKFEVRSHANAAYVKALWADLDCGVGKAYGDASEAYAAAVLFVGATGLPAPLVVGSGTGLHLYWLFFEAISAQEWQPLADKFKQLCLEHGLRIDPSRTADISSILRPVGTHNRKHGGQELVRAGEYPGQQSFAALLRCLGQKSRAAENVRSLPRSVSRRGLYDAIHATSPGDFQAAFVDAIAHRCAQVAAFAKSGDISEPHWRNCSRVYARCEDGLEKFHAHSANDFPGYNSDEAQRKFEQALGVGPTTCAQFDRDNPGLCARCPDFGLITSPIALGSRPVGVPATVASHGAPGDGARQLPSLWGPFRWGVSGQLLAGSENKKGEPVNYTLSETPIFLDCVRTAELDHEKYSYSFAKYLPKKGWIDLTIEAKTVHGPQVVSAMADKGAIIHDGKLFMDYVRGAVDEFHKTRETGMQYDQFGWKNADTAFLFGKYLYTAGGPVLAIGSDEMTKRAEHLGPKFGGNLIDWTAAVDELFADKMEAISIGVLCGFAAPLMRFADALEGGCLVHFHNRPGEGKTTAAQGGWTVWGVKAGTQITTRDTNVAYGIVLGTLCNLPIVFDELNSRDPEWIRNFINSFSDGRDRLRGKKDGGLVHTKAIWQTIMLSTSNRSLIEVATMQGPDGPGWRVFEFAPSLPPGTDTARGETLKKVMENNSGWAGDAYVRYLVSPGVVPVVKNMIHKYMEQIYAQTKLPNKHRFRVRLVACIATAGAIVNHLGLVHFDVDRILRYLLAELGTPENLGTTVLEPVPAACAVMADYINSHVDEMVKVADRFIPSRPEVIPQLMPRGKIVSMRHENNNKKLYIDAKRFREWAVLKDISPKQTLDLLQPDIVRNVKHLITLTAGTGVPGGQVPCIELNLNHPALSGVLALVSSLDQPSGTMSTTG